MSLDIIAESLSLLCLAVMVEWEEETYEITEGQGLVNVCTILTVVTDREVRISTETIAGTATGNAIP